MNGILNFVGDRLMDGNGAGMALNGSLLLLLAMHSLHLLTVSFSSLALSHHHLFLMTLHLEVVSFPHLPLTKLLFSQLAVTPLHHFSVPAEIWWRMLR